MSLTLGSLCTSKPSSFIPHSNEGKANTSATNHAVEHLWSRQRTDGIQTRLLRYSVILLHGTENCSAGKHSTTTQTDSARRGMVLIRRLSLYLSFLSLSVCLLRRLSPSSGFGISLWRLPLLCRFGVSLRQFLCRPAVVKLSSRMDDDGEQRIYGWRVIFFLAALFILSAPFHEELRSTMLKQPACCIAASAPECAFFVLVNFA